MHFHIANQIVYVMTQKLLVACACTDFEGIGGIRQTGKGLELFRHLQPSIITPKGKFIWTGAQK